jgi:hypothetical protein
VTESPLGGRTPRPVSSTEEHAARSGVRGTVFASRRGAQSAPASPYSHKFRLALAVLVIVAIGAIAIAVIALTGGRTTTPAWSAWKPQLSGIAGAREIAGYIAPGYRVSPEQQLAVINVSSSLSGSTLIVNEGPTNADNGVLTGNTVVYTFCGLGPACSIPGKPSSERLLLARLEAFELALYTFRYLGDYQNVVSILPPTVQQAATSTAKGTTPSLSPTPPSSLGKTIVAVEFDRKGLQPLLNEPLSDFFPPTPPALGGVPTSQAIATMDYLTANQLFTPSTETAQDGTQLLVLSQLPAQ